MLGDFCKHLKFRKNIFLLTAGELSSDYEDMDGIAREIIDRNIDLAVLYAQIPIIAHILVELALMMIITVSPNMRKHPSR